LRPCARRSRPAGMKSPYRLRKQLPEPVFGQIKAGPRVAPVPDARLRPGARRVGHRLHRPQSSQTRTQVDSVRSMPDGRHRSLIKARA
jgi:hypothetical protein